MRYERLIVERSFWLFRIQALMNGKQKPTPLSVEEYLAGELNSPVKHEYVAGVVYAMAGGKNRHQRIATNAVARLAIRLDGKKCQAFNSDTKVRVKYPTYDCFYYPDALVVCQPNSLDDTFQDRPVVIVEVTSPSTWRTDRQEKREAYLTLPSLAAYLIVDQNAISVLVYRRSGNDFVEEWYQELQEVIPLPEIGIELPLEELYASVTFPPAEGEREEVL